MLIISDLSTNIIFSLNNSDSMPKFDDLANSLCNDGKAKKLQMQGLQKLGNEAYIEVRAVTQLERNVADGLFAKPLNLVQT